MADSKQSDSIIPDGITRDHILQAMAEYDREGMPKGFKPSHTYDVVNGEKRYPPPTIMALSIKQLTGIMPPPAIRGGKGTKCFEVFEDCGFKIERKPKKSDS